MVQKVPELLTRKLGLERYVNSHLLIIVYKSSLIHPFHDINLYSEILYELYYVSGVFI